MSIESITLNPSILDATTTCVEAIVSITIRAKSSLAEEVTRAWHLGTLVNHAVAKRRASIPRSAFTDHLA
jgi:hypothetical protein